MREKAYRAAMRSIEAIPLRVRSWLFELVMLMVWSVDAKHRRIGRINLRTGKLPGSSGSAT